MKKILLSSLLFSTVLLAMDGEALFDMKCATCHMKTRPTPEMKSALIAPLISGVVKNVKKAFGDDKEATLAFIASYALEPKLDQAKCKPKAIERFGLMPSQKRNVTPEELKSIALYLYTNFPLPKKEKKMQAE